MIELDIVNRNGVLCARGRIEGHEFESVVPFDSRLGRLAMSSAYDQVGQAIRLYENYHAAVGKASEDGKFNELVSSESPREPQDTFDIVTALGKLGFAFSVEAFAEQEPRYPETVFTRTLRISRGWPTSQEPRKNYHEVVLKFTKPLTSEQLTDLAPFVAKVLEKTLTEETP